MLIIEPKFTSDWFTRKLKQWETHLLPLKGREVHGLEIGSYEGRSAIWLLDNVCNNLLSTLTCIDPWFDEAVEDRFNQNVGAYENLTKIKARSHEALRSLPLDRYDFIYIDGDHSTIGVLEDAVLAFRMVKPGGLLIFDDYLWTNPNGWNCVGLPKPAIDAFLAIYGDRVEVLYKGYQVFLKRVM